MADPEAPEPQERHTPAHHLDVIRSLDWRNELLAATIIMAEVCIVYLLASLFMITTETNSAYPFWIIAMLMLLPYFVIHFLDDARIFSPDFEMILVAAIVISLLIAIKGASFPHTAIYDPAWLKESAQSLAFIDNSEIRPVWGTLIIAVYAWWRGRIREEPSSDSAYTMLKWGSLSLAITLIIVRVGGPVDSEVRGQLSIGTIGFFAFALGAVGIARLKLEGFRSSAPLGPRWLATFVMPILVVIIVAIIGAGIFSRQFLDTVLWLMTPVFWVLSLVFQVLILIIAVTAFLILTPIFWLIGDRTLQITSATATATLTAEQQGTGDKIPDPFQLPDPLRYLVAAVFLFLIISALSKFFFRRRARRRKPTDEERESVLNWGDLLGSAVQSVKDLFKREPKADPLAHLRGFAEWRFTIQIRETYQRLQRRGEDAGRARAQSETAEEYRRVIGRQFREPSNAQEAVNRITRIYRVTRYSGVPASENDAAIVAEAWSDVQSARTTKPED